VKTIVPGKVITSLDQLYKCDFIILWGKPYHKGWFMSWQFRMLAMNVEAGKIFEGVKVTKVKKGDK
jgi:hypothetical protein